MVGGDVDILALSGTRSDILEGTAIGEGDGAPLDNSDSSEVS